MLRLLAVAALIPLAQVLPARSRSTSMLPPGASVYVTPTPNGPDYNGAPAVYPGTYPGSHAPAPVVVAPAPLYAPTEVAPQVYVTPAPGYAPTYDAPLQAYGAARRIVPQRRVYLDDLPRSPAPVPMAGGWRASDASNRVLYRTSWPGLSSP